MCLKNIGNATFEFKNVGNAIIALKNGYRMDERTPKRTIGNRFLRLIQDVYILIGGLSNSDSKKVLLLPKSLVKSSKALRIPLEKFYQNAIPFLQDMATKIIALAYTYYPDDEDTACKLFKEALLRLINVKHG